MLVFLVLVQPQRGEVDFFHKHGHWGLVGSRNGGLINWVDLPKHATILLQFLKSSTFIYSVFACFCIFFICF